MYYMFVYGPPVAGAALALVAVLLRRQFTLLHPGRAGAFAVLAAAIIICLQAAGLGIAPHLALHRLFPDEQLGSFIVPLALGIVGIAIVLLTPANRAGGTAELMRRSAFNVGPRSWFYITAGLLLIIIALTLWTSSLSSPDEAGHYRLVIFDYGPFQAGAAIYGWYFSVWGLGALLLLVAGCALRLRRISREPSRNSGSRRAANRVALAIVAGALLFHLATIFTSIAGAGSLQGGGLVGEDWVKIHSTLAALETPMRWASGIAATLGWAAWFTVLFAPAARGAAPILPPSSKTVGAENRT